MGENFGLFKSFGDRLFEGETPTNLGLIGSFAALDADVVAFFNRVIAAGGSLTVNEQNAISLLVAELKAINVWNGMKAIYPMVGSSAAACAQNLKSASFTGAFTSGWTFSSGGATPNGVSAYMNTGVIASSNLTLNNISVSYYSRNTNAVLQEFMGAFNGGSQNIQLIANDSAGFGAFVSYDSSVAKVSGSFSSYQAMIIGTRTSATASKLYRNSTQIASIITSGGSQPTIPIFVGAVSTSSSSAVLFSTYECAFSSIGDGLTDTQTTDFYTAVQAFQTTLSRQV